MGLLSFFKRIFGFTPKIQKTEQQKEKLRTLNPPNLSKSDSAAAEEPKENGGKSYEPLHAEIPVFKMGKIFVRGILGNPKDDYRFEFKLTISQLGDDIIKVVPSSQDDYIIELVPSSRASQSNESHSNIVLAHILANGSIDLDFARQEYGIKSVPQRISDWRKHGLVAYKDGNSYVMSDASGIQHMIKWGL